METSSAIGAGLSIIEQVNALECSTPNRPYLRGINHEEKRAVFFQPRCKLWSCPACAEINKRLWAVRAYHAAEHLNAAGYAISFLTLTSHEKLSPSESLAIWPKAWSKLRQRAYRRASSFQYLLVPEQHKDGRLHVHAIETAGLGSRWWKDNGRSCGLGYMAEEEIARTSGGAAGYVVKYLSKSLAYTEWPKGFRRVRVSRQWPKLPSLPKVDGWYFEPLPKQEQLDRAIDDLQSAGYCVALLGHAQAWTYVQDEPPD